MLLAWGSLQAVSFIFPNYLCDKLISYFVKPTILIYYSCSNYTKRKVMKSRNFSCANYFKHYNVIGATICELCSWSGCTYVTKRSLLRPVLEWWLISFCTSFLDLSSSYSFPLVSSCTSKAGPSSRACTTPSSHSAPSASETLWQVTTFLLFSLITMSPNFTNGVKYTGQLKAGLAKKGNPYQTKPRAPPPSPPQNRFATQSFC